MFISSLSQIDDIIYENLSWNPLFLIADLFRLIVGYISTCVDSILSCFRWETISPVIIEKTPNDNIFIEQTDPPVEVEEVNSALILSREDDSITDPPVEVEEINPALIPPSEDNLINKILPDEMLNHIFSFLNQRELNGVCKQWNGIIVENGNNSLRTEKEAVIEHLESLLLSEKNLARLEELKNLVGNEQSSFSEIDEAKRHFEAMLKLIVFNLSEDQFEKLEDALPLVNQALTEARIIFDHIDNIISDQTRIWCVTRRLINYLLNPPLDRLLDLTTVWQIFTGLPPGFNILFITKYIEKHPHHDSFDLEELFKLIASIDEKIERELIATSTVETLSLYNRASFSEIFTLAFHLNDESVAQMILKNHLNYSDNTTSTDVIQYCNNSPLTTDLIDVVAIFYIKGIIDTSDIRTIQEHEIDDWTISILEMLIEFFNSESPQNIDSSITLHIPRALKDFDDDVKKDYLIKFLDKTNYPELPQVNEFLKLARYLRNPKQRVHYEIYVILMSLNRFFISSKKGTTHFLRMKDHYDAAYRPQIEAGLNYMDVVSNYDLHNLSSILLNDPELIGKDA